MHHVANIKQRKSHAICIMGSHTIKGTDNGLYGEDPAQIPYSTGFPVQYMYIPQEIWLNIVMKISIRKLTKGMHIRESYRAANQQKGLG